MRMDEQQARLILQAYRPGDADKTDPHFSEALQETTRNPALARWFAEEQAFDRAMAAHLESVPAPFGLKTRILARAAPPASSRKMSWAVGLATLGAFLFLVGQLIGLWRSFAPASGTQQNYAREMVSFVRLDPPLEMESKDLGTIKNWLTKNKSIPLEVPSRLAVLEPVGCRVLSFRGHDVTLICFHRDGDRIAHLFVVDRAAFPKLKPGAGPIFSSEGEWTTASWAEKDRVYMIAVQGDAAAVQRYLPDA
jgi:anti-sigma factor RsiW